MEAEDVATVVSRGKTSVLARKFHADAVNIIANNAGAYQPLS